MTKRRNFAEFFSGAGMARAGLGEEWQCIFANDIDTKKCQVYSLNWGADALRVGDVGELVAEDIPAGLDLAWASFPCQDLSQAGAGAGLMGGRSGVFWPFWKLIQSLGPNKRPNIVVLENVQGAITSHDGRDFSAICDAFVRGGYRFGAVLINASQFVPQSRVRLFFIAVSSEIELPEQIILSGASKPLHNRSLRTAVSKLPPTIATNWIWWSLPTTPSRRERFSDLLNADDCDTKWHSLSETHKILEMMTELHLNKIDAAKSLGEPTVGTIYKRRRSDGNGGRVQRAEVRFDEIAGCLRTASGGASRQTIIVVEGEKIRTRILQPREAARLMGLSEKYILPDNYYEAYHLIGDGVVVPVVRHLAQYLLEPILDAIPSRNEKSAELREISAVRSSRLYRYRERTIAQFCWQRRRAQRQLARPR